MAEQAAVALRQPAKRRNTTPKKTKKAKWRDRSGDRRQSSHVLARDRRAALDRVEASGDVWRAGLTATFDQAVGQYLDALADLEGASENYKSARTYYLNKHVIPAFAGRAIQSITRTEVLRLKSKVLRTHGRNTTNSVIAAIRAVMRLAKGRGMILFDVTVGPLRVEDPLSGRIRSEIKANKRLRLLSLEQIITLLNGATGWAKTIILLALLTGLRLGELAALRWKDVRFVSASTARGSSEPLIGHLVIRSAVKMDGEAGNGKTEHSHRSIPFEGDLYKYLKEQHAKAHSQQDFVVSSDGRQSTKRAINYACRKMQAELGIGRKDNGFPGTFGCHAMRHACAALWIWHRIPSIILAEWMGHANDTITLQIYAYLFSAHKEGAPTWPVKALIDGD